MRKGKTLKRMLSILLSFTMVISLVTVTKKDTKASSSSTVISEDFETVSGDWKDNSDSANPVAVKAQETVAVMETVDLITNGDFENTEFDYTSLWGSNAGSLGVVTESDNRVLKAETFANENILYVQSGMTPGETYKIRFKIKGSNNISYHLFCGDTGLSSAAVVQDWQTAMTEWTTYEKTYTVPAGNAGHLVIQNVGGNGDLYIDDVSVTQEKEKTETTECITNGDFENNEFDYTSLWGSNAGSLAVVEDAGNRVLKAGTFANENILYVQSGMTPGETYKIRFKIKGSNNISYHLFCGDTGLSSAAVVQDWQTAMTEWTTYEKTYTVPAGNAGHLVIQNVGGNGDLYIDDFSVSLSKTAYTYSEGIGNCNGAEPDNVLVMEDMTEVIHAATITEGNTYLYSFKMKNDATGSDFAFGFGAGSNEIWQAKSGEQGASEWTTVERMFTATADADSIKFTRSGKGKVYVDDVSLREVVTAEGPKEITVTNAYPVSDNSWYIAIDDIAKATSSYYYMTIKVDGESRKVAVGKDDGKLVIWENFFYAVYGQGTNHPLESVVIPAGTVLYPIEDPGVSGNWTTETDADRLQITNTVEVYKVGSGWGMVTATHDTSATPQYYNIDNGTKYEVTTSANAYDIKKGDENIAVTTLSTVGTYDITRIEKDTKFVQKVVLYKNGDANGDDVVDSKDLVALKKQIAGKGTYNLSGQYAADMNRSGSIDDTDARGLRYSIANDTIQVSKGESTLNGVMPIVGFDGPDYDENRTDHADFITADIYDMVKELGINTVVANRNQIGTDYDKASKQLQLAEECGIKVYLNDAYVNDESNEHGITLSSNVNRLGEITAKYDGYSSFAGYYIMDEPMYNEVYDNQKSLLDFDVPLTKLKDYTNINSYLNLFPYICGPLNGQLGGDSSKATDYAGYKNYVDKASDIGAQELVYDMYLRGNGVTSGSWFWQTTKYKIHTEDFYTNLDWMRSIAAGQGKPFQAFVQVGTDFVDSNDKSITQSYLTTVQEMYLEANAALAMGAKGINYYSLIQPTEFAKNTDGSYDYYRSGLINAKGEKNNGAGGANYKYYNAAKKINTYIAKVDEVLMNATSKAVIATDSTTQGYLQYTGPVTSWKSISSVTGTKALVGCFDYYGKEAYYVVNTTPDEGGPGSSQTITLNFNGTKNGSYIAMGATGWTDMSQVNQLSLNVPAGESVLVVLD